MCGRTRPCLLTLSLDLVPRPDKRSPLLARALLAQNPKIKPVNATFQIHQGVPKTTASLLGRTETGNWQLYFSDRVYAHNGSCQAWNKGRGTLCRFVCFRSATDYRGHYSPNAHCRLHLSAYCRCSCAFHYPSQLGGLDTQASHIQVGYKHG